MKKPLPAFAFSRRLRSLVLPVVGLAFCLGSVRAQDQIPTECCSPPSPDDLLSVVIRDFQDLLEHFWAKSSNPTVTTPVAQHVTNSSIPTMTTTGVYASDTNDEVRDPGEVATTFNVYGGADLRIEMPRIPTGMLGLSQLYHSVLVVDGSMSAWDNSGTNIKIEGSGGAIPVPDVQASHLIEGDLTLQPRIGTSPGLFVFEFNGTYYQYGSPVDSGANPQTTAIFIGPVEPGGVGLTSPYPLSNNLSGSKLFRYGTSPNEYLEIKHVDGSVAHFESFNPWLQAWTPGPSTKLWRVTWVRDPYDNQADYSYNALHQLTSIEFPSGITLAFDFTPDWKQTQGWGAAFDCLELSYWQGSTQPAELAAKTWGMVFSGSTGTTGGRFFGAKLHRTYSPQRPILIDNTSVGPIALGSGSIQTGQIVRELVYSTATSTMQQHHRVHLGAPFASTLVESTDLQSKQVQATVFNANKKITKLTRTMTGEELTFAYPQAQRTQDLLPGTLLRAIEAENLSHTKRRYEFDLTSGRIYSVVTTASKDAYGQPRIAHIATENNGIGGPASSDVEPDSLTVYNIFDATCSCQKPIERRLISERGGQPFPTRTWQYEYDLESKLVTKRREPNPQAGTGPFAQFVEWTYTYTRTNFDGPVPVPGQDWGAWLLATEVAPDTTSSTATATYNYTYSDWLNRTDAARHGRMARTVERSLAGVRIQDSLAGQPSTSSSAIQETIWHNLPNLPAGLPKLGATNGQVRKVVDGDGVEQVFEYGNDGQLTKQIVGGIETTSTPDAAGNVTSVTGNATSAVPMTTTITNDLGTGALLSAQSTSGGLARMVEAYYDRFGHRVIERRNNLASNGAKPVRYGAPSGAARDWVETQRHYFHYRLMEKYVDRKPLDEAGGGSQFLVTQFNYETDGRLKSTTNSNGSSTEYTFDGYGTLYRTVTKNPGATVAVMSAKNFVGPFLDLTGVYEFTGTDHLWTKIARNDAGAITSIEEPLGSVPANYGNYSTGGASHRYEVDRLGRPTKAETFANAGSSTPLQVRELRYDQLDRQIWQRDEVVGTSDNHHTAWRYLPGKASQLQTVQRTGIAATTYTWNSLGLLAQVKDGFSTGNLVTYIYKSNTAFLDDVDTVDLDAAGGVRYTNTKYGRDAFGRVTTITQFDASSAFQTQLVHTYGYNSHGQVDRYTDSAQGKQAFLPDALGRIVEHVRDGGSGTIVNTASYVDSGEADGRTKETRIDGHAAAPSQELHATITHWDFAGRPFIVQNPGGTTAPTASSKHQGMSLYAEYDGASRLSALYDGDFGKTEFLRDGPGRVILRKLVNGGTSTDRISQWNTLDWLRRDALGRLVENYYLGGNTHQYPMGTETFVQDSLGRVHSEKFQSAFAADHVLETKSTWSGGNPFRAELEYTGLVNGGASGMETAKMGFGRDAIGRLSSVEWDRAAGSSGTMKPLAEYGWAGGLRRTRSVHYGNSQFAEGRSLFSYDRYGRLTQIKDDVYTAANTFTTKSKFDYEYDAASNLTKEKYAKVGGRVGDRFAYDGHHRLTQAWLGVDQPTMDAANPPGTFTSSQVHEYLTYGLDAANNRTSSSSLVATTPDVTNYTIQDSANAQGPSNRYDTVWAPGAPTATTLEHDDRGNLTYDGKFKYRYDYMNRLQEVWRVIPHGGDGDGKEKYGIVQEGALEDAQEAVKMEVPDLYSRLAREHTDPIFRARLRATISGGVIRITPTPQGGGGRPGFVPINGTLELVAVYLYDAFNRRTTSILVDPSVGETQLHTWDGWRQCAQHKLEPALVGGNWVWVAVPTKQFVWGSRLDEMVAYRRATAGGWVSYFVLHGGQETAAKLVDSSGTVVETYEYDPYGRVRVFAGSSTTPVAASTVGMPFLWKAIRLDEVTGLLQMRHRYYSVELGRFLTRDLLGEWGDMLSQGNGYCYAACCPLVMGDPLGLQAGLAHRAQLSAGMNITLVTNSAASNPANPQHSAIVVENPLTGEVTTYGFWPDYHPDFAGGLADDPIGALLESDVRKNHPKDRPALFDTTLTMHVSYPAYLEMMIYINSKRIWNPWDNCSVFAAVAFFKATGQQFSPFTSSKVFTHVCGVPLPPLPSHLADSMNK